MRTDDNFVVLGAIGFDVAFADGRVIFTESAPMWSTHCTFALEKTRELNHTDGTWQLVHMDSTLDRISMRRLIQAHEWCVKRFGADFQKPKP